jgi:hypothetical protein
MSIRFSKFVDITSVVGGASQVAQRQWCGRRFTTDPRVGPGSILQFPGQPDVSDFFGSSSEPAVRAGSYFPYVSPLGVQPTALQYARFVDADQPATIFGETGIPVLATLKAITAGNMSLRFGSNTVNVSGIDLSAVTTFADVATALQTALRAATGAPNAELTNAAVSFNAQAQAFDFTASPTGVVTEKFAVLQPANPTPTTDVAAALGWYASQGALVNGAQVAEAPVDAFNRVMNLNNNCGSFGFDTDCELTLDQATAVATANSSLNVTFIFRVNVGPTTWDTWSAALLPIAGVGLEYEDPDLIGGAQYIEMLPMAIQAAVNFNAVNGAVGYMYKQESGLIPSVLDDGSGPDSDTLDAARVNYYGQVQNAGQFVSFYQRGVLCGPATSPADSTIYANEQWFKDLQGTNLLNLQLSQGQIPANRRGQTLCEGVLQNGIDAAVNNGVISTDSTLTIIQQSFITSQTNDPTAWQQVQNIGYWMATNITSAQAPSGVTEYTLNYTIIYRKDDVVKTIKGSHQLI